LEFSCQFCLGSGLLGCVAGLVFCDDAAESGAVSFGGSFVKEEFKMQGTGGDT
jgi:hypothetical protein